MAARGSTANRIVLALLGLLLLAIGGLGLARGAGVFGERRASSPLLLQRLQTLPEGRPWFWWATPCLRWRSRVSRTSRR